MSMLHEISALSPRYKKTQRKGRGESSGRGKTSGRGNKGSKARTGTTFKRGFSNHDFERRFYIVNLADLDLFENGATVDTAAFVEKGLVPDDKLPIKILGEGEVTNKLTVVAAWYSKSAHERLTGAGGIAQNAKGEAFAFPKPKKKFIKREP